MYSEPYCSECGATESCVGEVSSRKSCSLPVISQISYAQGSNCELLGVNFSADQSRCYLPDLESEDLKEWARLQSNAVGSFLSDSVHVYTQI